MKRDKESGFTAVELAIVVGGIGTIAVLVGIIYAVAHFAAKFW